jgi:rhodanese-related sulfurtransferase
MSDPQAIKQAAAERAKKMGLSYAGALTPSEAHELMKAGAKLVDVRTKPELQYVGQIPGSLKVEWQTYPGSKPNPEFIGELAAAASKDEPVLFICRSGARSHGAAEAAMRAGWKETYNVLEGFEGDKDSAGHRNSVNGWRKAGLPWTQT